MLMDTPCFVVRFLSRFEHGFIPILLLSMPLRDYSRNQELLRSCRDHSRSPYRPDHITKTKPN